MIFLESDHGKTELHDQYVERRIAIESAKHQQQQQQQQHDSLKTGKENNNKAGMIIDYPTPKDALIGRGFPFHDFVG